MDETRFGLVRRPFPNTPDSESYYPATGHEQALALIQQAIADQDGILVLTGQPGTGKTLLAHVLLERLASDLTSALLTNSHFPHRSGLLQAILHEFSLPHQGLAEQELRLALTDFLLKNYAEKRRAVLILDEAQHLSADLLEELRLLGNLEARRGKALQVILIGQPALMKHLENPSLAALRQRLAVRVHLDILSFQEAADYLIHHVRLAGASPQSILSDEAVEILARGTQGIPRLLNQAAHQALRLAGDAGAMPVDAEAALEALTMLGLDDSSADSPLIGISVPAEDGCEDDAGPAMIGAHDDETGPNTSSESASKGRLSILS